MNALFASVPPETKMTCDAPDVYQRRHLLARGIHGPARHRDPARGGSTRCRIAP
jgi:hypothetical protein